MGNVQMKDRVAKLLIKRNLSVKETLKQMGSAGERALFVVNDGNILCGTVTDGDIRRWILKEGSLTASIEHVYNKFPKFVREDYDSASIKETMIRHKIEVMPVLDSKGCVVDALFWSDVFSGKTLSKAANLRLPVVVMAGGRGARLDPFTKILPKPLIPLGDKPIIEVIVDNFADYGCKDFYLVVNYKGKMIQSYFDNAEITYNIKYVWEDKPFGTVGGLKLAFDIIDAPHLFVSNCDIIVKGDYADIFSFHKSNDNDITIIGSVQHFSVPYGVLEIKNGGILQTLIEKPEYDFFVNTGMYVIKRPVIEHIPDGVAYDFPDLIKKVSSSGGRIGVYPVSQQSWIDIGQWQEYHKAIKDFK